MGIDDPLAILLLSALTLGVVHTAVGVDHSLPFVVLGRSRGWSLKETLLVTACCGLGHVLSSVALAAIGLGLGIAGSSLSWVEETRGTWAAWLLVGFGLVYAGLAIYRTQFGGRRSRGDGRVHGKGASAHSHGESMDRVVELSMSTRSLMPSLFVIFFLGPCEALLPLLTASGISLTLADSVVVACVFCSATIVTMLTLVTFGYLGSGLPILQGWGEKLGRHAHAAAGLTLAASGMTIQALGI